MVRQIISRDKTLNAYRIKVYPNFTSSKNESLEVKMRYKGISGYLLAFADSLIYFVFWAKRCQMQIPWILFIHMPDCYKIVEFQ